MRSKEVGPRQLESSGLLFAVLACVRRQIGIDKNALRIPNRVVAGQELAKELDESLRPHYSAKEMLILALPRGGVPVAAEVAKALGAPLDILMVRKLGTPGRPELALGAVASNGGRVLNPSVVDAYGVSEDEIAALETRERQEMARREEAYRGRRPAPNLTGRVVVLIDDGLATGATMRAAIHAAKEARAHKIVVAIPVAASETLQRLRSEVDAIHCLSIPQPFYAIGHSYRRFDQITDDEVCTMLRDAWKRERLSQPAAARAAPE